MQARALAVHEVKTSSAYPNHEREPGLLRAVAAAMAAVPCHASVESDLELGAELPAHVLGQPQASQACYTQPLVAIENHLVAG